MSPKNLAGAQIIPGDAITPGAPHPGDNSAQTFGNLYHVKEDDRHSQALGEIIIYFFVFKTHEDAKKVIGQINTRIQMYGAELADNTR
ncbi:hypothetical protein P4S72_00250 [Vibrio sp. PP-XX7]